MKRKIKLSALIIFLFYAHHSFSQNIEIIKLSGIKLPKVKLKEEFNLLEESIDTSSIVFVGTFKISGSIDKFHIIDHFYSIQEKSKRLGANAYFLDFHYSDSSKNLSTTIMSTYFVNEAIKIKNESSKPKNFLYVFGDSRVYLKNRTSIFRFNNGMKRINNSSEYFKYLIKEDEIITLNKGGFTGSTVEIIGKKNSPSIYLRLTGMNVGIQPVPIGMSISGGQIHVTDKNLSEFLIKVLRPVE